MMRILVVEDHVLVREGLVQALHGLDSDCQAMSAASADEALQLLEQTPDFDLILLDLMLPGTGGLGFLGALRKRYPGIPVLILSALDDADTIGRALRQGAAGYVTKSGSTAVLLDAIRQVLAGGTYMPEHLQGVVARRGSNKDIATRFGLTPAQMRVLELLVQGKTNREIGEVLGVTEGTVKIHVSAIFKSLDVPNRSQALLLAARYGLKAR